MTRWGRALALLALPVALAAQPGVPSPFPHARHAHLFPICSSCHAGVPSGDVARSFPPVTLCAACHDGTVQPRVRWTPPARGGVGLLVFSHPRHLTVAKDVTCDACHAVADTNQWMNVARAVPERCISCHAHGASAHLAADNVCATCHRPLTSAVGLSDARVAGLPRPPSHARSDFVTSHGAVAQANATSAASCATCHARETCERCHVDGARAPLIRALGADARVARLERGKAPFYPAPPDHRATQFVLVHGAAARAGVAQCAICHARASCETCHTGEGARDVLLRLPGAREATAPGVQLRLATPLADPMPHRVSVHAAGFLRTHNAMAASGQLQCAGCHAQRFCTDCHAGEPVTHRYHLANFLYSHAPQAYGRETDCSSCHSTEAFCRSCHRQAGLAAKTNARSTVFHNAQPLWLLQHGRAARQDLNSCTTCHQQKYCMQCHSDLGARINPHGPGFDAARMSSKNPGLCLTCHFKNPLGR